MTPILPTPDPKDEAKVEVSQSSSGYQIKIFIPMQLIESALVNMSESEQTTFDRDGQKLSFRNTARFLYVLAETLARMESRNIFDYVNRLANRE